MSLRTDLMKTIVHELYRQYRSKELSWFTSRTDTWATMHNDDGYTASDDYVAIDGSPNIGKIADAIIAQYEIGYSKDA